MREMIMTKEGVLTESFVRVMVTEDGTVFEDHNEAKAYEKIGIKTIYPAKISFGGRDWIHPEFNGYDLELIYSEDESFDKYKICFDVNKEGLFLKNVFHWDKCTELDIQEDLLNLVGTPIEDIANIHFALCD